MAKRILLLGKNGQVGWELQRSLAPIGQVLALGRHDEGGDLTDPANLTKRIQAYKPDIIVNASAYTAVDKAETEQALAFQINAEAVGVLAELARRYNSWLIHYSTDYVFDGSGSKPWRETDQTNPINSYGKSKLAGEQAIEAVGGNYLIFRTSWVYASQGNNFIKTMLRLAKEKQELNIVSDQIGAPTGAELIADITAQVVGRAQTGIYHLAAAGETSWYDFANLVFSEAKKYISDELKISCVNAISSDEYATAAKRPLNSRLDTTKLINTLDTHLPDWQQGVKRVVTELLNS